ncbi:S-adenosylmethionine--2-demethylmenaquinone methyltransferase, partial [Rhizobium leguminosarum]
MPAVSQKREASMIHIKDIAERPSKADIDAVSK